MKKILSLSAFLTLALFVGAACQTASTANTEAKIAPANNAPKAVEHEDTDDAPRISLADAKKEFDAGTAIFVDTRAEEAYKNEHIKGSINISSANFEAKYKELPTDKKIIAYCS